MKALRRRPCGRAAAMPAALLLANAVALPALANGPEQVRQIAGPVGHTVWQITRPRVNQPSTDYPQIVFHPGELVTITAAGCVQTGGAGHTWKRWADPAGKNSDVYYHGQVAVPGATAGLVPIDVHQPAQYLIPASATLPASPPPHLTLGYADDHFGDNGYADRNSDDGNYSQCWQLGDAVVTVDIGPAPPPAAAPALAGYTFTVESVFIRSLRSRQSDTDVLGAGVVIDGTQSSIAEKKVGNWHRGGPHPAAFSIALGDVTPDDRVNIAYAITNAGHGNENKIDDTVANIVEQVAGKVPVYGTIVAAIAEIWAAAFNLLDPDCDGPVFADNVMVTGRQLAAMTGSGAYRRTVSAPGTDSAIGCGGNSFYEVTYSITRNPAVSSAAASLAIDARSLRATVAAGTRIIRARPPIAPKAP